MTNPARSSRSALRLLPIAVFAVVVPSCDTGDGWVPVTPKNIRLVGIEYGRLADVYSQRFSGDDAIVELYRADVLIGPDIHDPLPGEPRPYVFLPPDPGTLQPRVVIVGEPDTAAFDLAFRRLDDSVFAITPGKFGDGAPGREGLVPRNAAIRLTFSDDLELDESFFAGSDADGEATGFANTEAVQVLEIVRDPRAHVPLDALRLVPTRIVAARNQLILDPVFLGSEAEALRVPNHATGLPESGGTGRNIRVAIALDGELAIPGLDDSGKPASLGVNRRGVDSIVWDFRSGNRNDDTPEIHRGFLRDDRPLRIVGDIPVLLERVDPFDDRHQVVTLFKDGRSHDIDAWDTLRFIGQDGRIVARADVVADPVDDRGRAKVQRVRVRVRRLDGLADLDPRKQPGHPSGADRGRLENWLRQNAPRVILSCEFAASRPHPETGDPYGDEPANFVRFAPAPLPLSDGTNGPPNQNVSPFANAVVRFNKPLDMTTVGALDTFFIATREVIDPEVVEQEFIAPRQLDPLEFDQEKFKTPHLVASRIVDEDGATTTLRLVPIKGLYLDETMRARDEGQPFEEKRFRYVLHVVAGSAGIRDLGGNPIDLQADVGPSTHLSIPFALDTRSRRGQPVYADNLVVSVVRRFESVDEDEQPSLFRAGEAIRIGDPPSALSHRLQDVFGAVTYVSGTLLARPTSRVTRVVDDLNQTVPPDQATELRFCPSSIAGETQIATASAAVRFGQALQDPLNPYGCRQQVAWREIDMSLSRVDPFDFDLDVERMWWGTMVDAPATFDVYDRVSLFLGHSEHRPEPCVGAFSALPTMPNSGLGTRFQENYVHNLDPENGEPEPAPPPHVAFVDEQIVIDPNAAIAEPRGQNKFLPLPPFQRPYFVWRDQTMMLQGGNSGAGSDVINRNQNYAPYVLAPGLVGGGRLVTQEFSSFQINRGAWGNTQEFGLRITSQRDVFTGGGVGSIGLPLLCDLWAYVDDPDLPAGNPFFATGANGWQVSLAVQSAPDPAFRAYSSGFPGGGGRLPVTVSPGDSAWQTARGGFTSNGQATRARDNTVFWVMADFLKRQTVATFGFVDVFDPHRTEVVEQPWSDPRLGPFFLDQSRQPRLPRDMVVRYDWISEPPLDQLPAGTKVTPEFRGADRVDPDPWRWQAQRWPATRKPDAVNFPLDPLKACDAHIRKYDDRIIDGQPRDDWTFLYTRKLTGYTDDIRDLADDEFVRPFAGDRDAFWARDVRYFNWRFVMENGVDAPQPVSPALESFAVAYRFERR